MIFRRRKNAGSNSLTEGAIFALPQRKKNRSGFLPLALTAVWIFIVLMGGLQYVLGGWWDGIFHEVDLDDKNDMSKGTEGALLVICMRTVDNLENRILVQRTGVAAIFVAQSVPTTLLSLNLFAAIFGSGWRWAGDALGFTPGLFKTVSSGITLNGACMLSNSVRVQSARPRLTHGHVTLGETAESGLKGNCETRPAGVPGAFQRLPMA
ncbi:hypothetical protein C8R46DRAFT_223086 [Mycena filopes]|nr:hypothetical protein C8R46DRAFT_223086 [Mycena filopes]